MRSATAEGDADGHRCRRNRVAVGRGDRRVVRAARLRRLPSLRAAGAARRVTGTSSSPTFVAWRRSRSASTTAPPSRGSRPSDGVRRGGRRRRGGDRRGAVGADVLRVPRRAVDRVGCGAHRPGPRHAWCAGRLAAVGAGDPVAVLGPRDLQRRGAGTTLVDRAGDPLDLHRAFAARRRRRRDAPLPRPSPATCTSRRSSPPRKWRATRAEVEHARCEHHARRSVLVVVGQRRRRRGRHPHQLPRPALAGAPGALARPAAVALRSARRARTCASATTDSTARWCSSSTPTS